RHGLPDVVSPGGMHARRPGAGHRRLRRCKLERRRGAERKIRRARQRAREVPRLHARPLEATQRIAAVSSNATTTEILPESKVVAATPVVGSVASARNVAIDAYRGLVMLLMMAEVLRFSQVAQSFPGNWFWHFLSYNQSHVPWAGCSLHDTIQPSFSFL